MKSRRESHVCLMGLLGLLVALRVQAAVLPAPAGESPDTFFAAALRLSEQANDPATPAGDAPILLLKAISECQHAAQLRPEFYRPQALWARCLMDLALREKDPAQRQAQYRAACERFASAARCADVDWVSHHAWGRILMGAADKLANTPATRRAILADARQILETARELTRFSGQRAKVDADLAECSFLMAGLDSDPSQQRDSYTKAIAMFAEAAQADAVQVTAEFESHWAFALAGLGKVDHDPALLLQSVEHLDRVVAKDPDRPAPHFNLACALALAGASDRALQQLRECLDRDPERRFYREIQNDPDLQSLRDRDDFKALLAQHATDSTASKLFTTGQEFQKRADEAKTAADTAQLMEKAVAAYEHAAAAQKDFALAYAKQSYCLLTLATLATTPEKRTAYLQAAREQFAAADRCPGTDWTLRYRWTKMLTQAIPSLAQSPAEQRALLVEVRASLESVRERTRFSADRAGIDRDLGLCLIQLAEDSAEIRDKAALYRQAADRLASAVAADATLGTATVHRQWGGALGTLAKLTNTKLLYHQAIDQFQTAADKDPTDPNVYYNLSCCYALIGQTELALRNLAVCIEKDPNRQYATTALTDLDLKSLRGKPAFEAILAPPAPPSPAPRVKNP